MTKIKMIENHEWLCWDDQGTNTGCRVDWKIIIWRAFWSDGVLCQCQCSLFGRTWSWSLPSLKEKKSSRRMIVDRDEVTVLWTVVSWQPSSQWRTSPIWLRFVFLLGIQHWRRKQGCDAALSQLRSSALIFHWFQSAPKTNCTRGLCRN